MATGFVRWWPAEAQTPVEFAHPLYRAGCDDLSPTRRQDLHRVAAEVLDAGAALAHRVAATDHVDDDLADEIDEAARRELSHGDVSLAARYLLWASTLSSRRERTEHRLLEAARLLLTDGQTARAGALRPRVEACEQSLLRSLVLGTLAWDNGDAATAERWLLGAATVSGPTGDDYLVLARALAKLGGMYATGAGRYRRGDQGTGTAPCGPHGRRAWMDCAGARRGEAARRSRRPRPPGRAAPPAGRGRPAVARPTCWLPGAVSVSTPVAPRRRSPTCGRP